MTGGTPVAKLILHSLGRFAGSIVLEVGDKGLWIVVRM